MRLTTQHLRQPAAWTATCLAVALLQGCAGPPPPPPPPPPRIYAVDQQGAAKSCKTDPVTVQDGKQVTAAMAVGNDGGWCAIPVSTADGKPYAAGLLTGRPAHGTVYIHTVGNTTRIDYTPARGYAGPDGFTATLLPGNGTVAVTVTVAPG